MTQHKPLGAQELINEVVKSVGRVSVERYQAIKTMFPVAFDLGRVTCHWRTAHDGPTFIIRVELPDGQSVERFYGLDRVPSVLRETMPTELNLTILERERKQELLALLKEKAP